MRPLQDVGRVVRLRAELVLGPFAEPKEPVLSNSEGTSSRGGETPQT